MCSSLVMFPLISCTRWLSHSPIISQQIHYMYRSSPHIGAQAAYMDSRGMNKTKLVCSFFVCLFIFYFMYASCYFLWTAMMFPNFFAKGVNDLYFFYVSVMEFLTLLFVRTRSTIKYLPKYITILNICYLYYINQYFYAAMHECLAVLFSFSLFLFIGFLKFYEQPA